MHPQTRKKVRNSIALVGEANKQLKEAGDNFLNDYERSVINEARNHLEDYQLAMRKFLKKNVTRKNPYNFEEVFII